MTVTYHVTPHSVPQIFVEQTGLASLDGEQHISDMLLYYALMHSRTFSFCRSVNDTVNHVIILSSLCAMDVRAEVIAAQ